MWHRLLANRWAVMGAAMRRTWLVCGWATLGAGLVGLLALGLAALGGAPVSDLLTAVGLCAALLVGGHGMVARAAEWQPVGRQRLRFFALILPAVSLAVLGLLFAVWRAFASLPPWWPESKEEEVLTWTDPATGTTYTVTQRQGLVKCHTKLIVRRGDIFKAVQVEAQMDDDASFGTASLVKLGDWVLVFNGDYALGGYNAATDTIYGEWEWDLLPSMVRNGQGTEVARAKVSDVGGLPAGYEWCLQRSLASRPSR